jgi:ABC-type antimicrobial peptide transport system permease subunit
MRTTGLRIVVDGMRDTESVAAGMIWASPGYFETLRIPVLHGRAFDARDRADAPRVAVVGETMARQCFGTVNAVGRRFREESASGVWFEIIGVVRDTGTADLQGDLVDPTRQLFYRAVAQSGAPPTTIVARTSRDANALVAAMQRELRAADAALPAVTAKTMAQVLEDSLKSSKAVAAGLSALGALGLMLASIGLYAVVAFAVSSRSREIGIRLALGARRRQVMWSVTHGVAALVGIGTAVGLTLSLLVTLALRVVVVPAAGLSIYRPGIDPASLLAIAAAMAVIAVAAAWVPASRAALADPMVALRRE